MVRTVQNQVPVAFNALYNPILKLKNLLNTSSKDTQAHDISSNIVSFMLAHYTTFLMTIIYRQIDRDIARILEVRKLIEAILANDTFDFKPEHKAKLFSFIDNLAKELNTTPTLYLHVAIYDSYLDAEIYRCFHSDMPIFDFLHSNYISQDTVIIMKQCYDEAMAMLKQQGLSSEKRMAKIYNIIKIHTQHTITNKPRLIIEEGTK